MDCQHCEEQFSALLEGSETVAAQECRQHLQSCPVCRAGYESFSRTVGQLRALPLVSPPDDLRRRLATALDAARPARGFGSYWQPLTAGASLAACLMVVAWAVVLQPMAALPTGGASPYPGLAASAGGEGTLLPPGDAAPAAGAAPPAALSPSRPPARGDAPARQAERAPRRGGPRAAALARQSSGRPLPLGDDPLPADFGDWGSRAASLPATAPPAAGQKPPGTFALGAATPDPVKGAPGELQLAFTPPLERLVGTTAVGQLLVTSQAEANITIRIEPRRGLRLTNAADGVLYRGPIRRGDPLQLPVRMVAARPGPQRLQITVEADVPGVATELPIILPEFAAAPAAADPGTVKLVFHDTPSVRAIRELAAAAGARVSVADGLAPQLVTQDFSAGVPFRVALRVLCESCGYRLEERAGEFYVLK